MSLFRRGDVWWYEFWFAGRRIQESSKSPSKTIARTTEQNRRRELEEGFNNFTDIRRERVRTFSDVADEFFNGYSESRYQARASLSEGPTRSMVTPGPLTLTLRPSGVLLSGTNMSRFSQSRFSMRIG
jgi:hypothetical protein